MMKHIAIVTSLTLSTFAHAQTNITDNLPISLKNIAGKWACESVMTDKELGMQILMTHKAIISAKGLEKSIGQMTMAFHIKELTGSDASVYYLKDNSTGFYTLDNGQLSVQNISGNITHVKHVSGIELIPTSELKKEMQDEIAKETREKIKTKISTSLLTSKQWNFSTDEEEINVTSTCFKL